MDNIAVICPACGARFELDRLPDPDEIIECPVCKAKFPFKLYKRVY